MNEKLIKTGIIIISVIVILCIIMLVYFLNSKTPTTVEVEENNVENKVIDENAVMEDLKIEKVKDKKYFYTVNNYVQYYLDEINRVNFTLVEENNTYIDYNQMNKNIMGLLSKDYIANNNINVDKIYQEVENINEEVTFVPLEMNMLEGIGIDKYVVHGYIVNTDYELIKDLYIIVTLDNINKTFSIEPVRKEYNNIADITIENNNEEIEENDFNKFEYVQTDEQYIVQHIFDNYKALIFSDIDKSYAYLDDEYKEKRFDGNIDLYKEYIDENLEELKQIKLKQYLINTYPDYTEYVCKDQYENLYIFRENAIMDYAVQLDTYTIMTDKFKEEYLAGNKQKRVAMNIDKFIQMINGCDYKSAYEVLNEVFKQNNFSSEEAFKEYMQNTYYRYNKISLGEFSDENNGTYVYRTIVSNKLNEEEEKEMNIIMILKDETNFEMSFEII